LAQAGAPPLASNSQPTSIRDLTPDGRNARKRTNRSASLIQESLQRFGAARSIVIDEDGRILAGNGTVEGAKAAGIERLRVIETEGDEIVAIRRTGLTEEQKIGLALADNRTSDLSEWDGLMLQELSAEQDLAPWFDADELAGLLPEAEALPAEEQGDPDAVPGAPVEPITKPGDVWLLGKHRVMCGDSTSIEAVESLMAGELADLLLTDPPYNVAYEGKTADALTIKNDSMADKDFRQFLRDVYTAADTAMKPGAVFYVWHADSEGYNFRGAAHDVGWQVRQCLIWNKSSLVLGRQDYHWKHEPCLYGWKDGAAHFWGSDRSQTTVMDFNRPSRNGEHPTMKPVELFQYQLENSSKPGGFVLDLFGGSGTTLIAAEKTNRQSRLMELDPVYCDVIVKRWQAFAGKTATLEATGEPFPPES
jgi:site-specific DNA-methyltransferase (adenine-specific)